MERLDNQRLVMLNTDDSITHWDRVSIAYVSESHLLGETEVVFELL